MKYFESLDDLPIYNFWKVRETGDLVYLFQDWKSDEAEAASKRRVWRSVLVDLWRKMDAEFIENFAMTDEFFNRLLIEKKIINLQLEYMISKSSVVRARLKGEQQKLELNYHNEESKPVKLHEFIAGIEKYIGFQIDEKKISTNKVYSYVNQMKEQSRLNEKQ
jgi:hypothetical protein